MNAIRIPRLGWSMEEGTFVRWLKQPGEMVAVGDPLFELEGEKALQTIESVDAGVLHIPADSPAPGSVVPVGGVLGYLLAKGEVGPTASGAAKVPGGATSTSTESAEKRSSDLPPVAGPAVRRLARELDVPLGELTGTGKAGRITQDDVLSRARAQQSPATTLPAALTPAASTIVSTTVSTSASVNVSTVASPRARRVAAELGIDWRMLRGTGRDGRVRESDVRAAAHAEPLGRTPLPSVTTAGSGRRKTIADRLRVSRDRTIPVTLTTSLDATNLVGLREQFKSRGEQLVPAVTDLTACVVARVLRKHPAIAVVWDPRSNVLQSISMNQIDIGLAVDTPEGLIVPVLRNVGRSSLLEVTRQSKSLIERARRGALTVAELQGGIFTITNLGAFGVDSFTPVINYPEVAILGVGAIRREVVVLPDDRMVPQARMTLSLTFDHAALDGAPAAAFLRDVVAGLENVAAQLLSE